MREVRIGKHTIGPGHRPFVIAEMSGNHNGSLDRALAIVDAVAAAGAQALKLQTYRADTITIDVDLPAFRISDDHTLWGGENLYRLYEKAHTPWEWHAPIFERAHDLGLTVFSSPFDPTAVELLESLETPAYKIASAEIVDLPLVELCARTGKPLVISTGMANVAEIHAAVSTARAAGNDQLIVLGCTASYPAPPQDSNLRGIPLLGSLFDVVPGLSDHTVGIGVPVAAVALGACAIDRQTPACSATPSRSPSMACPSRWWWTPPCRPTAWRPRRWRTSRRCRPKTWQTRWTRLTRQHPRARRHLATRHSRKARGWMAWRKSARWVSRVRRWTRTAARPVSGGNGSAHPAPARPPARSWPGGSGSSPRQTCPRPRMWACPCPLDAARALPVLVLAVVQTNGRCRRI